MCRNFFFFLLDFPIWASFVLGLCSPFPFDKFLRFQNDEINSQISNFTEARWNFASCKPLPFLWCTYSVSSNWIKLLKRFGSVRCAKLSENWESAKVPKGFILKRKNVLWKIFFLRFLAAVAKWVESTKTFNAWKLCKSFEVRFYLNQWFTSRTHMRK